MLADGQVEREMIDSWDFEAGEREGNLRGMSVKGHQKA
jgi:hypothetical protein